jgi:hypothetical protein
MQRSVIIKLFLNEFVGVYVDGSNERIILIFALSTKEEIRNRNRKKTKGLTNAMWLVRAKPIESRMLNRTQ